MFVSDGQRRYTPHGELSVEFVALKYKFDSVPPSISKAVSLLTRFELRTVMDTESITDGTPSRPNWFIFSTLQFVNVPVTFRTNDEA